MADRQTTTFPVRGLDLATSGHGTQPGDMRLLSGMVPVGYSDRLEWEVPNRESVIQNGSNNDVTDVLSLGWQRRETIGPNADLGADPNQSLERLVALKADGIYVIDPGQSHQERQLYTFDTSSTSRRATFAQVGDSLFIAVYDQPLGDPTHFFELRDDVLADVQWPELPRVDVTANGISVDPNNDDPKEGLPKGPYAFRLAYELEDGTIGPTTSYFRVYYVEEERFEARFEITDAPSLPGQWQSRVNNLVVIGHAPNFRPSLPGSPVNDPRIRTQPEHTPGRIVKRIKDFGAGAAWTIRMDDEEIRTSPQYEGIGLRAHQLIGGAPYSFNERLIVGDARYDLAKPSIEDQFVWADGVQNSGGDDYWMLLQVVVQTQLGEIVRLSEPRPFDSTAATQVELRNGHITYPDERARRYDVFVSQDYTGDIDAATWSRPSMLGMPRRFEDSEGSALSFSPAALGEPYSLTITQGTDIDPFQARQFEQSTTNGQDFISGPGVVGDDFRLDSNVRVNTANADDSIEETLTEVVRIDALWRDGTFDVDSFALDFYHRAAVGSNNDADGRCQTELTVEVREKDGTILANQTETITNTGGGSTSQNSGSISFTRSNIAGWSAGDAYDLRFRLRVEATASDGGSGFATAGGEIRLNNGVLSLEGSINSGSPTTTADNDVNSSRIIWSAEYQPLDLPAENVVFAGSAGGGDPVLALQAVGQEVSEGQYGEYPIVVFGRESVRVLQTGTEPFIQASRVIEADAGLVGRRAYTNIEGVVVGALDIGVYQFTPQQQTPAFSSPIHDDGGDVLGELGPDTALSSFLDQARGRREVWMHLPNVTLGYNTRFGSWFALDRNRLDTAFVRDRYYAVRGDNTLVEEEQDDTTAAPVRLQTAVIQPGPQGHLGRAYEVQLRQPFDLDQVTLSLVATDPTNDYVKLGEAVLQAGQYDAGLHLGAGLAPGFVVDVQGDGSPGQMVEAIMLEWEPRHETLRDHQGHGTPGYAGGTSSPILVLTDVSTP